MSFELRNYQHDIIAETRAAMEGGCRNSIIVSPTGSGKTVLTAFMLKTSASKGLGSAFLVHRRELLKQSSVSFSAIGVDHGIVAAGFMEDFRHLVQIASIPSLRRRIGKMKSPRLVLWDEAHHLGATTWAAIHAALPNAFHVGLTATPQRLDGKGLGRWFQKIILGPSVEKLIAEKYLAPYRIFTPPDANSEERVITGSAIREYMRLIPGKRAVIFAPSIEFSKRVAAQFSAAGFPAEHVDGESDPNFRDESLRAFADGHLKIISNVALFGEGLDIPAIDAVIDLAPTNSLSMWLQRCGRALRPNAGKDVAYIIDHAGNAERHGFPDDAREWTLEGSGVKGGEKKGPSIKTCPTCFAAMLSTKRACEFCGFIFPVVSRQVDEVDGKLQEFTIEERRALRSIKYQEQRGAETITDLIEIGKRRGYKRPELWAGHVFRARQAKRNRGL